jgi:hypothetical protein
MRMASLLLVIDSDALFDAAARAARRGDHAVRRATSVAEAAAELLVEPADLLVLDHRAALAVVEMAGEERCAWLTSMPVLLFYGDVFDASSLNVRDALPLATFSLAAFEDALEGALRPAWEDARAATGLLRLPPA